jgi:hypothetical protein
MKKTALLLLVSAFLLIQCGGTEAASGGSDGGSGFPPQAKSVAVTSNGNAAAVAVDAGFSSDGAFIDIPTGFTASQCNFTASPIIVEGDSISTSASINSLTGEVVCQEVINGSGTNQPATTVGCPVSYTVVCIQEPTSISTTTLSTDSIIMPSSNGKCYQVTINSTGTDLQLGEVACP